MSRYDKQLRKSIQRIVLDSPALTNALDAYANRGGFGAAVGSAASDAEEARLCCDGSTGDPNPGTSERDPDSGGQDGLDPNDPANLGDMGEGSLAGLTDCATGVPICFEGADCIPPEGWDDCQTPSEDPTYDEGFAWYGTTFLGATICATMAATRAGAQQLAEDNDLEPSGYSQSDCTSGAFNSCSSEDRSRACDPDPEDTLSKSFPSDGCVNLSIQDGTIVGSKYDPENDGTYSTPMAEIQLCDGSGNQISLSPSADGGWKTIDAINGGDGYLYDSSGTQIARISEAEYSDPNV